MYIEKDFEYQAIYKILKKILLVEGEYDFIMMHHSFEYMRNPIQVFNALKSKLRKGITLLLRILIADSEAWKKYQIHWAGLDAPHHIFLHIKKSIAKIAELTGFRLIKITFDSDSFQF